MDSKVTIGLIQAHHDTHGDKPVDVHKKAAIDNLSTPRNRGR